MAICDYVNRQNRRMRLAYQGQCALPMCTARRQFVDNPLPISPLCPLARDLTEYMYRAEGTGEGVWRIRRIENTAPSVVSSVAV